MTRRMKKIVIATSGVIVAAGLGGAAFVQASGDDDRTVTGAAADRAGKAALEIAGGGTVKSVERDDAGWEVEIAKPGGKAAEVDLDTAYKLVGTIDDDRDDAGSDDAAEHDDD